MEDNTVRKIKVTLRDKESLLLLLEELETVKGEVDVELGIKDTKSNYSLLARSPFVLDWDFITAGEPRQEEKYFVAGVNGIEREDVTKTSDPDTTSGILRGIEPWNWNQVAWRIESIWRAALKSPAVLFQSDFFWRVIEQVSSLIPTPEHAILVKLSEARWSGWKWEEVEEDLTQILNHEWKSGMGKKSLTELSRCIYGKRKTNSNP